MSAFDKKFLITHIIDKVSDMEVNKEIFKEETHFGIPWKLTYSRKNNHLALYVECSKPKGDWSIDAGVEISVSSQNETCLRLYNNRTFGSINSWGMNTFVVWNELEEHYIVDGKVTVSAIVTIKKMVGFGNEKLKFFDETNRKFSDVVLVVDAEKFYVSKLFLSSQSRYFESLLLGSFEESKQSEVVLKDINQEDFQSFLELLHGEPSINDNNIDGIFLLADMYDAPVALRRCEEFLRKECEWSVEEKLELATRYNLKSIQETFEQQISASAVAVQEKDEVVPEEVVTLEDRTEGAPVVPEAVVPEAMVPEAEPGVEVVQDEAAPEAIAPAPEEAHEDRRGPEQH